MKEQKTKICYITKYWSTQGIKKHRCEEHGTYVVYRGGPMVQVFRLGSDAFFSAEAARAHVKILKKNKLKSIQRQLEKISAIVPDTMEIK
jgi:hypothetical protein